MGKELWKDRSVFITGATGLLGTWLTKALLEHDASVVALVRDWVPESELVRGKSILPPGRYAGDAPAADVQRRDVRADGLGRRCYNFLVLRIISRSPAAASPLGYSRKSDVCRPKHGAAAGRSPTRNVWADNTQPSYQQTNWTFSNRDICAAGRRR